MKASCSRLKNQGMQSWPRLPTFLAPTTPPPCLQPSQRGRTSETLLPSHTVWTNVELSLLEDPVAGHSQRVNFRLKILPGWLPHHPWSWKVGQESCDRHPEERLPFHRLHHGQGLPCRTPPPRWLAGKCRGSTRWGQAYPTPPPAPYCTSGWRWGSTSWVPSPSRDSCYQGPIRCPLKTRRSNCGTSLCENPPLSYCWAPPEIKVGRKVRR